MNRTKNLRSPALLAWGPLVSLAGLACFALPPHLIEGAIVTPAYGHPLIPWFAVAFANWQLAGTMISFFVLGIATGIFQPCRWLILGCLAMVLSPVLHIVNIIGDVRVDPTDHNLLPFEFVILGFLSWPVLLGAFLGSRVGRRIFPSTANIKGPADPKG